MEGGRKLEGTVSKQIIDMELLIAPIPVSAQQFYVWQGSDTSCRPSFKSRFQVLHVAAHDGKKIVLPWRIGAGIKHQALDADGF